MIARAAVAARADWFTPRLRVLTVLTMLALAGCTQGPEPVLVPPPPVKPEMPVKPKGPTQAEIRQARAERNRAVNREAEAIEPGDASKTQRDFYARLEQELLRRGRLRREQVPLDAPIDAETLTRNFIEIALHDEYSQTANDLVADVHAAPLRRWQQPVRMHLDFGPSSDVALQRRFRAEISSFAARLREATGHNISVSRDGGNFTILVLTDDERRNIAPKLAKLVPGMPSADVNILSNLSSDIYCTAFAYSNGSSTSYSQVVVMIRSELPPLLQLSCIHEELAQGMGLSNDSPEARPSIFNDDDEFALLTRHDQLLLKMLYDPRLRPGMSEAEAKPIAAKIAAELLP